MFPIKVEQGALRKREKTFAGAVLPLFPKTYLPAKVLLQTYCRRYALHDLTGICIFDSSSLISEQRYDPECTMEATSTASALPC